MSYEKVEEFLKSINFFSLTYEQQVKALTDLLDNKERALAEDLETRKRKFILKVEANYSSQYSIELLIKFCDYWTEHNDGGRKMRFEMHKIFDISRRLKTWHGNNIKYNKKSNERYNVGEQDHSTKLADARPGLFT